MLRYFSKFDFVQSLIIDDLHTIYLGVVKKMIDHYFERKIFGRDDQLRHINLQMNDNSGSSDVGSLQSFDRFSNWKGKDFRNFLFHYGLPLLIVYCQDNEIINNFKCLQEGIYTMSTKYIDEFDLSMVREKIGIFLNGVKNIFGFDKISPNFHELAHLPDMAKHSGPLWLHSTFDFEGFNLIIRNFVRSSLRPELQIIDRLNMVKSISSDIDCVTSWDDDLQAKLLEMQPGLIDTKSVKLLGSSRKEDGENVYQRAMVGSKRICTAEYSAKFKKTDHFVYQNGDGYSVVKITGGLTPMLVVKKLRTERISLSMLEVIDEQPGHFYKPLDNQIQKMVPMKVENRTFLSFLPEFSRK